MSVNIAGAERTWCKDKILSFQPTLIKALYFIFPPGSVCSSDVYRRESGRYCTLPFFLIYFHCYYLSDLTISKNRPLKTHSQLNDHEIMVKRLQKNVCFLREIVLRRDTIFNYVV